MRCDRGEAVDDSAEYATVRQYVAIAILLALFVGFVVGTIVVRLRTVAKDTDEVEVPAVVTDFLHRYVQEGYEDYSEENNPFFDTFLELDGRSPAGEPGSSEPEDQFFTIFKFMLDGKLRSYSLEPIADDFVIIKVYDADGKVVNPPVGFWYTVVSTPKGDRIGDWYLARLQPFSRYDEEYSEGWNEIA